MRTRPLLLLLLLPAAASAQQHRDSTGRDSVSYYRSEQLRLRRHYDSLLRASPEYQRAQEGLRRQYRDRRQRSYRSDNYAGFVLLGGIVHSDVAAFNAHLARTGFPAVRALAPQFGLGISGRSRPFLFDFYFFTGSSSRSKKGAEEIQASLVNGLQFDLGVDVLHAPGLSLYPFAGLSFRTSMLAYTRPEEVNPAPAGISELRIKHDVDVSARRLGYQAGLGLDVRLASNRRRATSSILFVKGGINRPVWKDRYRYEGVDVGPGPKQGDWVLSFGIKFAHLQ